MSLSDWLITLTLSCYIHWLDLAIISNYNYIIDGCFIVFYYRTAIAM